MSAPKVSSGGFSWSPSRLPGLGLCLELGAGGLHKQNWELWAGNIPWVSLGRAGVCFVRRGC